MATVTELVVRIRADVAEASAALNTFSGRLEQLSRQALPTAAALAGLSAPLILLGKQALDVSLDYERAMNVLGAVTQATAEEMAQAAERAKELGADMTLPATSAADAARAMTELAKGGLDLEASMTAAKGALALAAAGGMNAAQAATTMASALNAFKLPAAEATMIADRFAAAANASALEVKDVADALKMSAAVWQAFQGPIVGSKQAFEDLTVALALLGNAGMRGSDAGTSLKQALLQLTGPSDKAAALMQLLQLRVMGVVFSASELNTVLHGTAKERMAMLNEAAARLGMTLDEVGSIVFDTAGNMRPFREILDLTAQGIAGLTDAERNYILTTIFGADATRSITILLQEGSESWDRMAEALGRQNAAQELAEARMRGLSGALENLQSQLETVWVQMGEIVSPVLESIVRAVAEAVAAFGSLPDPVLAAVAAFAAVIAAAGPLALAFAALGPVLAALAGPVGLVVLALGALAAAVAATKVAWDRDWLGMRTAFEENGIQGILTVLLRQTPSLLRGFGMLGAQMVRAFIQGWTGPWRVLLSWLGDRLQDIGNLIASVLENIPLGDTVLRAGRAIIERLGAGIEQARAIAERSLEDVVLPTIDAVTVDASEAMAQLAERIFGTFEQTAERTGADTVEMGLERGVLMPVHALDDALQDAMADTGMSAMVQLAQSIAAQRAEVVQAFEQAVREPVAQLAGAAAESGGQLGDLVASGLAQQLQAQTLQVQDALSIVLQDAATANVDEATGAGSNLGESIVASISAQARTSTPQVQTALAIILQEAATAGEPIAAQAGQFLGGQLFDGMIGMLMPRAPELVNALAAIYGTAQLAATPPAQQTGQFLGGQLFDGMTDMLMPRAPELVNALTAIYGTAQLAATPPAQQTGQFLGGQLFDGMTDMLMPRAPELVNALTAVYSTAQTAAAPLAQQTGQFLGGQLFDGMTSMLMPSVPTLSTSLGSVFTAIVAASAQYAAQAGTQLGTAFTSALSAAAAGGLAYASGGIAGISATLTALSSGQPSTRPGGGGGQGKNTTIGGSIPPGNTVPGYTDIGQIYQVLQTYSAGGYQQQGGAVSTVPGLAHVSPITTAPYTSGVGVAATPEAIAQALAELGIPLEEAGVYNPATGAYELPAFQSGGLVRAPRGRPVRAIVHGGEVILPADLAEALRAVLAVSPLPISHAMPFAGIPRVTPAEPVNTTTGIVPYTGPVSRAVVGLPEVRPVSYNINVTGVGLDEVAREIMRRIDLRERTRSLPTSARG